MPNTLNAASLSQADIITQINLASDGDTIILPPGQATWTTPFGFGGKSLTFIGATQIIGDHNSGNMTYVDGSIIYDGTNHGNDQFFITLFPANNSFPIRWSGLTFADSPTRVNPNSIGQSLFAIQTDNPNVRLDHIHFGNTAQSYQVWLTRNAYGVMDHCIWSIRHGSNNQSVHFQNGAADKGDQNWADFTNWGGSNFFFMEDCQIDNDDPAIETAGNTDAEDGARYVMRYCIVNNAKANDHGTETRSRSVRAVEVYKNRFSFASSNVNGPLIRGGTWLIHQNIYSGMSSTAIALLFRNISEENFVWPLADGTAVWDVNDQTDHTGNTFGGGSLGLYASGLCAADSTYPPANGDSNGFGHIITSQSFPVNIWAGFSVRNIASGRQHSSLVYGNSSNVIYYKYQDGGTGNNIPFLTGDTYEIRKINIAMDQPGRGKGDLISGAPGSIINTITGTPSWPRNAPDPIYNWLNRTPSNVQMDFGTQGQSFIQPDRDYYNENQSFSGTSGVGVGLLSARPSSGLTAGVGYWATDSGPQGTLYVATGPSTWVTHYTPFTYPHPLVTGGDLINPTVSITSPIAGSVITGTISITAAASDNVGVAGVTFKVDGVVIGTDTTVPYSVSWDSTTVLNGSRNLTATAQDTSGNTSTASILVNVNNNADVFPPTVSITSPTAGQTVSGTISVQSIAADNVAIASVQFFLDGSALGSLITSPPYSTSWNTATTTDAVHSLTAVAKDTSNNSTTSAAISVTVSNRVIVNPPTPIPRNKKSRKKGVVLRRRNDT